MHSQARKSRGVFWGCRTCTCTDDGDDRPPSAIPTEDMRVVEAVGAAKKAEAAAFVKKQQMLYEREARENMVEILAQVRLEKDRAEEKLKQAEEEQRVEELAIKKVGLSLGACGRLRSMSDGDLSGIDTDTDEGF